MNLFWLFLLSLLCFSNMILGKRPTSYSCYLITTANVVLHTFVVALLALQMLPALNWLLLL